MVKLSKKWNLKLTFLFLFVGIAVVVIAVTTLTLQNYCCEAVVVFTVAFDNAHRRSVVHGSTSLQQRHCRRHYYYHINNNVVLSTTSRRCRRCCRNCSHNFNVVIVTQAVIVVIMAQSLSTSFSHSASCPSICHYCNQRRHCHTAASVVKRGV